MEQVRDWNQAPEGQEWQIRKPNGSIRFVQDAEMILEHCIVNPQDREKIEQAIAIVKAGDVMLWAELSVLQFLQTGWR